MPNNYLMVDNFCQLQALRNHDENEIVYCQEEQKMYRWNGKDWEVIVPENGSGIEMNLYDLNKNIISQLKPLTKEEVENKLEIFSSYHQTFANKYYMLLCKEYSYYTVFAKGNYSISFAEAVKEIVAEIGDIYSIELTENKAAIEIWIKPDGEEEPYAFYLFPYDGGIVYYG